jgi:hypothetical protein
LPLWEQLETMKLTVFWRKEDKYKFVCIFQQDIPKCLDFWDHDESLQCNHQQTVWIRRKHSIPGGEVEWRKAQAFAMSFAILNRRGQSTMDVSQCLCVKKMRSKNCEIPKHTYPCPGLKKGCLQERVPSQ